MGDLTPAAKARLQAVWDRTTLAHSGPTGTWAQRWLPWVCKHQDTRCVHGDEINHRGTRVACMVCGRSLDWPHPVLCWFTGTRHTGTYPEDTP